MRESKVSPTPWEWLQSTDYPELSLNARDGNDVLRIYLSHGGGRYPSDKDAEFIIRAANSHAAAVAAMEDALSMCRYLQQAPEGDRPYGVDIDRVADKCRAALAAAKGAA